MDTLKAENCPLRSDLFHQASAARRPIPAGFQDQNTENHSVARRLLMGDVMLTKAEKSSSRAFTLVELMTVVVIVGVLAALGTYGVRKYVLAAKKAEAVSMLTQIRAAEEAYRDEMFQYLGGGTDFVYHPVDDPGPDKRNWSIGTPNDMTTAFSQLGVRSDGPVFYSYSVVAGNVGTDLPSVPTKKTITFPSATGPVYVAVARADLNGDGAYTYAVTHSDSSQVFVEEDTF